MDPAAELEIQRFLRWCHDREVGPIHTARLARRFRIEPFSFLSNSMAQKYFAKFVANLPAEVDRTWPARIPVGFHERADRLLSRPATVDFVQMAQLYKQHGPMRLQSFLNLCHQQLPMLRDESIAYWYHGELRMHKADAVAEDEAAAAAAAAVAAAAAAAAAASRVNLKRPHDEISDASSDEADQALDLSVKSRQA